jgi:hypothetical protein
VRVVVALDRGHDRVGDRTQHLALDLVHAVSSLWANWRPA